MAEVIKMPKMSDTMTDGVLAKWHKKVGDKIKSGDVIAEIETDKATMDFESYQDGTLLLLLLQNLPRLHLLPKRQNLLQPLPLKWIPRRFRLL